MITEKSICIKLFKRYFILILHLKLIILFTLCSKANDPASPGTGPINLIILSGDNQEGLQNEKLNEPVIVKIMDEFDQPMAGIEVEVHIEKGWGEYTVVDSASDETGIVKIEWILGSGPENLMNISLKERTFPKISVTAYTKIIIQPEWISGIDFSDRLGETILHDDRILETENFLIFSDYAGDQSKLLFAQMAEETFAELKQLFEFPDNSEFRIEFNDSHSKIKVYNMTTLEHTQEAFAFGIMLYGSESPVFHGRPLWQQIRLKNVVKHEMMHLIQYLMGLDNHSNWPSVWFTEGIAEYVAGGAAIPFQTMDEVNDWYAIPGHENPVNVRVWGNLMDAEFPFERRGEYYQMFELAARYIFTPNGFGKSILEAKNIFEDMLITNDFSTSFEKYIQISENDYQSDFFNPYKLFQHF
ncbi:hypothetical protein ACFL4T_13035, partial [candidate division KSB1 bacterium]